MTSDLSGDTGLVFASLIKEDPFKVFMAVFFVEEVLFVSHLDDRYPYVLMEK
jgi:hypothetical protein